MCYLMFVFKQKTAYELRISDWSSDVCSSDLLTNRGYYLGSNVSYNVKKMVENDYLVQERSTHDRRSIRVRASEKGLALWQKMDEMFNRHTTRMGPDTVSTEDLTTANAILARPERF